MKIKLVKNNKSLISILAKAMYMKLDSGWAGYPDKEKLWEDSADNSIVKLPWIERAKVAIEFLTKIKKLK